MARHELVVLILFLFFMNVKCQRGGTADYVRHPVNSGFSYYVSIRTSLFETHHCAGTLIAPNWVLTSASCMDRGEHGPIVVNASVYIGNYELESEAAKKPRKNNRRPLEHIDIEGVVVHNNYSNGTVGNPPYEAKYDIALLKLKTPSNYSTVSLDIEGITECCEDEELWNVGFGRKQIAGAYATKREAARFPFFPYNYCRRHFLRGGKNKYFQRGKNLTRTHSFCVKNPQDQCNLDLGSPLVVKRNGTVQDRLVGFVTAATGQCSFGGDPFVFGNLNGYMDWIVSFEEVLADISKVTAERRLKRARGPTPKGGPFGIDVEIEAFPFPVSISNQGTIGHICGGALISPYHVITAANCVYDPRTTTIETYTITVGSSRIPVDLDETPDAEIFDVNSTNVILRERNGRPKRDVAIVRLPGKSKFSPAVIPLNIRNCCDNGTWLTALGWGSRSAGDSYSPYLHATRLSFVPFKVCKNTTKFSKYPTTSFCSGNQVSEGAMCSGDMGNPVVLGGDDYDVLIGIATPEVDSACEAAISQFYKVTYLRNWIRRVIDED